jgi:hypothetical protein
MRRLLSQSPNSICAYNNIIIIILSLGIPTTGSYRRILVLPECVSFGRAGLAGWRLATPPQFFFFFPVSSSPRCFFPRCCPFSFGSLSRGLLVFLAGDSPSSLLILGGSSAGVSSVSYCSEHEGSNRGPEVTLLNIDRGGPQTTNGVAGDSGWYSRSASGSWRKLAKTFWWRAHLRASLDITRI